MGHGAWITEAELHRLAFRDHVTGLPNRAALAERMNAALERAGRDGDAVGLLFIDLDGFKLVNDTLGHAAGDELLQRVAARLEGMDGEHRLLARQGGDEFLLLCERLDADPRHAAEQARAIAAEVQRRMRTPFEVARAVFEITVSIGIGLYPQNAADADVLIQRADQAMYTAKRRGRGGCELFSWSEQRSRVELETTLRVRRALEAGHLELFYQPVVEVADGFGLGGLEALLRWRDPERGLLAPADFLGPLEHSPLLEEIGEWVYAEVCRQLAQWQRRDFMPRVSFNIPARQLRRPGFADFITRTANAHGTDLRLIAAEITESGTVDLETVVPTLDALRDAGLSLSLDDFGTGYSSLSRLRDMPFSLLKTDLGFMRGIPGDPSAMELMEGIIALGRALGMVVIVEGVETAQQLNAMLGVGCRVAQGFFLGHPAPAADIETRWARRSTAPSPAAGSRRA